MAAGDVVQRTVRVEGIEQVLARLDVDVLAQPEFDAALETFSKRTERQGKGLGAKRNTIARETRPLMAISKTTLNYPRTKGTAYGRKQERILRGMAPNVIKKAVTGIAARWAT